MMVALRALNFKFGRYPEGQVGPLAPAITKCRYARPRAAHRRGGEIFGAWAPSRRFAAEGATVAGLLAATSNLRLGV